MQSFMVSETGASNEHINADGSSPEISQNNQNHSQSLNNPIQINHDIIANTNPTPSQEGLYL